MFILDGKTLSPDNPFTHNGIQYPANWLRLSTLEEKEAIGIKEIPDPPAYDQRFYWGYDKDGNLIPKDHDQLVQQWKAQTRTTAGTLLAPSDWMVVRYADNGTAIPSAWQAWREQIRVAAGTKNAAIQATTSTAELAAYITGTSYPTWPQDPDHPVLSEPTVSTDSSDTILVTGDVTIDTTEFAVLSSIPGASGADVLSFDLGTSG